jgi:hypothetical protein
VEKTTVLVLRDLSLFRELWADLGRALRHRAADCHRCSPTNPRCSDCRWIARPWYVSRLEVLWVDSEAVLSAPATASAVTLSPSCYSLYRKLWRPDSIDSDWSVGGHIFVRARRARLRRRKWESYRILAARYVHSSHTCVRIVCEIQASQC